MPALYQKHQIRELESLVMNEGIDDEWGLMNKAGAAAFQALQARWPLVKQICVYCGKGNNAGDGFVVARLAHEAGFDVTIVTLTSLSEYKAAAFQAAQSCVDAGLELVPYHADLNIKADLIVDAILGIGIKGEVSEVYADMIESINLSKALVLAIDVPSGIDVDTGVIYGTAVKADATITFIGLKQGLFTNKAASYCGIVICDALNIPDACFEKVRPSAELLDWDSMKTFLPHRERDAHKGKYGHVLVIGGDYGMGGAVRMAAEAAMRVGAGLVTVATRPEHVSVVNTSRPEIMCHQITKAEDLIPLLKKATVVVIGPGLGKTDWAKMQLELVLSDHHPKVLDADALNLLSENPDHSNDWVLTPHPGEASRLLGSTAQEIQADRFVFAKKLQEKYGGIIVLKGAGSIVFSAKHLPKVCPAGNPGMATGGMGDVLSGVIGGLMAQGISQQVAAELGVLVHAIAADCAAEEGGERGLLATDLMPYIRQLVNPDEPNT